MLNQTRIWVGSITFHRIGSMYKNVCRLYDQIQKFVYIFIFKYYFGRLAFSSDDYAYLLGRHADSNRNGGR